MADDVVPALHRQVTAHRGTIQPYASGGIRGLCRTPDRVGLSLAGCSLPCSSQLGYAPVTGRHFYRLSFVSWTSDVAGRLVSQ